MLKMKGRPTISQVKGVGRDRVLQAYEMSRERKMDMEPRVEIAKQQEIKLVLARP